jgi:hypothetical protein
VALIDGRVGAAYYDPTGLQLVYTEAADAAATQWQPPVVLDNRGACGYYLHLCAVGGQPAVAYTMDTEAPRYVLSAGQRSPSVMGGLAVGIKALRFARRGE